MYYHVHADCDSIKLLYVESWEGCSRSALSKEASCTTRGVEQYGGAYLANTQIYVVVVCARMNCRRDDMNTSFVSQTIAVKLGWSWACQDFSNSTRDTCYCSFASWRIDSLPPAHSSSRKSWSRALGYSFEMSQCLDAIHLQPKIGKVPVQGGHPQCSHQKQHSVSFQASAIINNDPSGQVLIQ